MNIIVNQLTIITMSSVKTSSPYFHFLRTDVIYPTPLPPASPEDPCHTHTCIAGAECQSDGHGRARCVCDIYCSPPPRYEPVCGSDMEFYESECLMRLHACNIQVQLFVMPVHECASKCRTLGLLSDERQSCGGYMLR